jgi:hypothetical protein
MPGFKTFVHHFRGFVKLNKGAEIKVVVDMPNNFKVDVDDTEEPLEVVPEELLEWKQEDITKGARPKETA